MQTVLFMILGYLSGSVLYARLFAKILKKENMIERSKDQNPGTANAFVYGGFWCGVCTLFCDILKGFVPVYLYIGYCRAANIALSGLSIVIAAPVIGHIFPLYYKWKGGKGIATTFGCLLGLMPLWQPSVILAGCFIFYSTILRISPHFYRTLAAYFSSFFCMIGMVDDVDVLVGFFIMIAAVTVRMLASKEEKEKLRMKFL